MDQVMLTAFGDELSKMAGIKDWWQSFIRLFRPSEKAPEKSKADRMADYHFSPRAGDDKWDKLLKNVRSPTYVEAIIKHPSADPKLIQHVKSMHQMARGFTVGKIRSSRLRGRSYEIKEIPGGLACTCPDWRFRGSVNPGYECKHIKAHRAGKVAA